MPKPAHFGSIDQLYAGLSQLARLAVWSSLLVALVAAQHSQAIEQKVTAADSNPGTAAPASSQENRAQVVRQAIQEITAASAVPAKFVLEETKDGRAEATRKGEQQIIGYNRELAEQLSHPETRWIALLLLAHEVGHHYLGHTMQVADPMQLVERELLADRFSGKAIARLGGTMDQLKAGFLTYHRIGTGGIQRARSALPPAARVGFRSPYRKNRSHWQPDGSKARRWRSCVRLEALGPNTSTSNPDAGSTSASAMTPT